MEPKEEILKILDAFGMSGIKAAEAMGVTYATFRNKKNDNSERHTFNQKNLDDLKSFIFNKAKEYETKT